jgi:hypothetical protein
MLWGQGPHLLSVSLSIRPVGLFPGMNVRIFLGRKLSNMFMISTPNCTLCCTLNDSLVIKLRKQYSNLVGRSSVRPDPVGVVHATGFDEHTNGTRKRPRAAMLLTCIQEKIGSIPSRCILFADCGFFNILQFFHENSRTQI